MRDSAVVRLMGDELFWYPPGRSEQPISLQDKQQKERLKEILQARRSPVIFAVPGADVRLQQVQFNANEKRHMSRSLPYLLEEEFASDVEDLHTASTLVSGDTLAVASTEHRCVDNWQAVLGELSGITRWVPEPLLLPWHEGEITLVIEAGQALARFGASDGFAVETDMLDTMLSASSFSDVDYGVDAVIVYGQEQAADTALIPEHLRPKIQWRSGGFSASLLLSEDNGVALNMLQGEYGPKLPLSRWAREWRWPLIVLAAAFVLQLISTYAEFYRLEQKNLTLRQAIESSYRQAIPQGAIVDPERQLQRSLNELRGGSENYALVGLLETIGSVIQAENNAQINTINFSGRSGELRFSLLVPDFEAVERVRVNLNKKNLIAEVESSNAQGASVRARLKARGK